MRFMRKKEPMITMKQQYNTASTGISASIMLNMKEPQLSMVII